MNTTKNVLAIIPARGGSKGILGKNLRQVAGWPLIAHAIEAAKRSSRIDRIIVSTDSSEIETVTKRFGAEIVRRPSSISGDAEPSESALLHVLEHLRSNEKYEPELLAFLQSTSPLMMPEDIDGTIEALIREEADSALVVAPHHRFIWKRQNGTVLGINHDPSVRMRRQDRENEYVETGSVYVMRTTGFLQARHRFFGKIALHIIPAERALEIDDPADLEVAEVLIRKSQREQLVRLLPKPVAGIVFDFDGIFTDNKVLVSQEGIESVRCDRGDGYGIGLLQKAGIPMIVLSKEQNPVVTARCRKLNLDCIHGLEDKLTELLRWADTRNLTLSQLIYVGNDLNDIECMKAVGCPICPSDAIESVKPYAKFILERNGGDGAVRELAELILRK